MIDKLKTLKLKALSAALLVSLLAVIATPPAPAHAAASDCGNYPGTVCLFAHSNYGLPIWRQYPSQITGCRNIANEGWNDITTIVRNNTSGHYVLVLWQDSSCSGSHFDAAPATTYDLTNNPWNDQISAVSIVAL